jgi:hypothetical protein
LLGACNSPESTISECTIPSELTRVDNFNEVKAILSSEREQFQSLTEQLAQIQLEMDYLYDSFEQIQDPNPESQEMMLELQKLVEKKEQTIKVLTDMVKTYQEAHEDIIDKLR